MAMLQGMLAEDLASISSAVDLSLFDGKRVLVSGGAGFLGSWLSDALLLGGARVFCVDDFSSGTGSNVKYLLKNKQFSLRKMDIVAGRGLRGSYDFVVHLASRASPVDYQKHPVHTLQANSQGTKNMLDMAEKSNAVFLYSSSSEIYGNPSVVPTPEDEWGTVNPTGVRSSYDEGKRFGEALCMAYYRSVGVNIRVARIFNTYGPRLRQDGPYGRVVLRFLVQALDNKPITVFGDGSQTRSFCYVTDTIGGLVGLLTTPKAKGEVFNIGNTQEITVLDLAKEVIELTGSKSEIVFKPLPQDDPPRRCPAISKADKVLGWKPTVSLSSGIERTIAWLKGA